MTTQTELFAAIFHGVSIFAAANNLPVKYPAKKFTPPASGEWLELSIAPNDIDSTLSEQASFKRGIVQVNVAGRPDTSPLKLTAIADLITLKLPKGLFIVDSVIVARTPYQTNVLELDDRVLLPVTINYSE